MNTTNLAVDLTAPQRRLDYEEQGIREPLTFPHPPAGLLSGRTNIPAKQKDPLATFKVVTKRMLFLTHLLS